VHSTRMKGRTSGQQAAFTKQALRERLAARRAKSRARAVLPAPRYDEVFAQGLQYLDEIAGVSGPQNSQGSVSAAGGESDPTDEPPRDPSEPTVPIGD